MNCRCRRRRKYAEARKQLNDAMSGVGVPDGRQYGYAGSQVIKAYDPYNAAGENNYYRTWQLQRHGGVKEGRDLPIPPPPYHHQVSTHSSNGADPRYVEHIYESPKFERRQFPEEPGATGAGGGIGDFNPSQQYFELDPEAVSKHGEASTSANSNRTAPFSPRNFSTPRV